MALFMLLAFHDVMCRSLKPHERLSEMMVVSPFEAALNKYILRNEDHVVPQFNTVVFGQQLNQVRD